MVRSICNQYDVFFWIVCCNGSMAPFKFPSTVISSISWRLRLVQIGLFVKSLYLALCWVVHYQDCWIVDYEEGCCFSGMLWWCWFVHVGIWNYGVFCVCNSGLAGIESMGMGSTFVESFWWKDSCGFGYLFVEFSLCLKGLWVSSNDQPCFVGL